MLVARVFQILAIAAAVLVLMDHPRAEAQQRPDLDALVYGQQSNPQQQRGYAPQPQPPAYAQAQQPNYAPPPPPVVYAAPAPLPVASSSSGGALAAMRNGFSSTRNLFRSSRRNPDAVVYGEPVYAQAPNRPGLLTGSPGSSGLFGALRSAPRQSYAAAPTVYAASPVPIAYDSAYRLDAGDKLRIVVYGQEGLTNTYAIDAGGSITMPLIGSVSARGRTPAGLASQITGRLRDGYIREPSVAVEIESYRPFFILGEVAAPGQYPYVPNMSVESAVAIAGGFSPRARRDRVTLTHTHAGGSIRAVVPTATPIGPGDTILVGERWF